jgi:hypothetical protein
VLQKRLRELARAGKFDREIAAILNAEHILPARGASFQSSNVHRLRRDFGIQTGKINGVEANPARWPDGSYSVQGAAAALRVTSQTIFDWLRRGRLSGRQKEPGQPWQIDLAPEKIRALRSLVRRTKRSK